VAPARLVRGHEQVVALPDPVGQYPPAAQGVQVAKEVPPVAADDVPAGHRVHVAAEVDDHDPAGHAEQVPDPAVENNPAAQAEQVPDPAFENDPAGHAEQVPDPGVENNPAGQAEQVPDPAFENNPAAHGWHVELEEAPMAAENVPAGGQVELVCAVPPQLGAVCTRGGGGGGRDMRADEELERQRGEEGESSLGIASWSNSGREGRVGRRGPPVGQGWQPLKRCKFPLLVLG